MVTEGARTSRRQKLQYAALPWRKTPRGPEILLITTRTTRRWIVPKGWPLKNCTPAECAAYEALEEAGVIGTMAKKAIGTFLYDKHRKSGEIVPCKVEVFPMEVITRRRKWVEMNVRESRWCSCAEAMSLITDAGLLRLIAKFARLWKTATPRTAIDEGRTVVAPRKALQVSKR
jgi:8-oxo-dGTP pyrophosphatase MutT (NUDIX family)